MDIYLVFGFISEDGSDEGHTYIYGVFDNLHLEDTIDRSYFDKMATKAVEAISEYGDFDSFASDDTGLPPWQKPDIPWDDVQDEAAQNFDVR